MLLLSNVLPGQLPGVLSAVVCHDLVAAAVCHDLFLLAQGTRKLGLVSPEVRGAEWSEVG